jgi:arginase family enzyme
VNLQILNLDDALLGQQQFLSAYDPDIVDFRDWGPRIRLGCSFRQFRRFERDLHDVLGNDPGPRVALLGSGDFHHVTLALLRRLREPFVLLVLDNHPDWMTGFPFMHCGTWLAHALDDPRLERVIHLGGNADFNNGFRLVAPKRPIRDGKIVVAPAKASLVSSFLRSFAAEPLLDDVPAPMTGDRLDALLRQLTPLLDGKAVYVTFDKDVLVRDDAVVNWDSGSLRLPDSLEILSGVFDACGARLLGMDIVGDWSPVRTDGLFRWGLHALEHPLLRVDPRDAAAVNEQTNLSILELIERVANAERIAKLRHRSVA